MVEILFPLSMMAIGFLMGLIATDAYREDKRVDRLERRIRILERRVDG